MKTSDPDLTGVRDHRSIRGQHRIRPVKIGGRWVDTRGTFSKTPTRSARRTAAIREFA